MKKINFKWLLLSIILSIASINTAWANNYLEGDAGLIETGWNKSGQRIDNADYTHYAVAAGTYYFKVTDGSNESGGSCFGTVTGITSSEYGLQDGDNPAMFITISEISDVKFHWANSGWNVDITVSPSSYYIKYPWGESWSWTWSAALTDCGDGTFACTGPSNGTTYDLARKSGGGGSGASSAQTATEYNSPTMGDKCVFCYDPSTPLLTITRCNTVATTSHVYFDNSVSEFTDNLYFIIGHDKPTEYSTVYAMTNVSGTNYYHAAIGDAWSDATYYAVIASSSNTSTVQGADHKWGSSEISTKGTSGYTAAYTGKFDLDGSNKVYTITTATSGSGKAMTITYQNDGIGFFNKAQTLHVMFSNNGGVSYSDLTTTASAWHGTITAERKYLDSDFGTVVDHTGASKETLSSSAYAKTAIIGSNYVLAESSTATGYTFAGWGDAYDDTPDGETSKTISSISAANDAYAFFKANQYTIKLYANDGGDSYVTQTATYNETATSRAGSLPTRSGYGFDGYWTAASGGTKVINKDGTWVSSVSGYTDGSGKWICTEAKTLYAHWLAEGYYIIFPIDEWEVTADKFSGSPLQTSVALLKSSFSPSWKTTFKIRKVVANTASVCNDVIYGKNSTEIGKDNTNTGNMVSGQDAVTLQVYYNGTYTFELNTSGPQVTVSVPIVNQLQIYSPAENYVDWDGDPVDNVVSTTITLARDQTYEFKPVYDSKYYGKSSTTLDRENNSVSELAESTGNLSIEADYRGSYQFNFNIKDKALTVVYPTLRTVTFSANTVGSGTGYSASPSAENDTDGDLALSSGDYVADGDYVTFTAKSANAGYTFKGWYSEASPATWDAASRLATTTSYTAAITANTTVYAVYDEDDYTVTVQPSSATMGSVASDEIAGHKTTSANLPTATANTGYFFKNWTTTAGNLTNATSATTASINNLTSTATVTANFESIWAVAGGDSDKSDSDGDEMGDWSTDVNLITNIGTNGAGNDTGYVNITLPANSEFKFKVVDRQGSKTYYGNGGTWNYANSGQRWEYYTTGGSNSTLKTAGAGTYKFAWNMSGDGGTTKQDTLRIYYPASYTITYDKVVSNGQSIGSVSVTGDDDVDLTSGEYVAKGSATFTASEVEGYTMTAWRDANSSYGAGSSLSTENPYTMTSIAADKTVYAHYAENLCTVTIKANNSSRGSIKVDDAAFTWGNTVDVGVYTKKSLKATPATGYYFAGWTLSDGADCELDETDEDHPDVTLTGLGASLSSTATLTANFQPLEKVYFRNWNADSSEPLWENVYVFFGVSVVDDCAKSYDSDSYKAQMDQEGTSNIYWAYVPRAVTRASGKKNIAFSDFNFNKNYKFYQNEAVLRTDYVSGLNMFVPRHSYTETHNSTKYYDGYWKHHNLEPGSRSGYSIERYQGGDPAYVPAAINGGDRLHFLVVNEDKIQYTLRVDNTDDGHNNYMIYSDGEKHFITRNPDLEVDSALTGNTITTSSYANIPMCEYSSGSPRFYITPTTQNLYTLTIDQSGDRMKLTVDYPVAVGDYRLHHTYTKSETTYHAYSDIIKPTTSPQMVSMYINTANTPTLALEKCTDISPVTWTDQSASLSISTATGYFDDGNGVYQFVFTDPASARTMSDIKIYDGEFYIKTDTAPGGWTAWKANVMEKNTITFNKADATTFDHSFCHWVDKARSNTAKPTNVKCVIANDYNIAVSDTLEDDAIIGGGAKYQTLPSPAHVRFSYNSTTNELKRTYLNITGVDSLILEGNTIATGTVNMIHDPSTDAAYSKNKAAMGGMSNFTYSLDVKAREKARVRLSSKYNGQLQDLIGETGKTLEGESNANTVEIMGGLISVETYKTIRIIYDFKTNYLMAAWLADGVQINADKALKSDLMIIREGQGDARQITFGKDIKMTDVDTVYGVMKFTKTTLNNTSLSRYERDLYWISFPFNVQLSDAFGMGTYGIHWIIERYDGKGRAQNGFWSDSEPNWKFVTPYERDNGFIMNANEGYILALDLDELGDGSLVWDNGMENAYLYFPSNAPVGNIQNKESEVVPILDQEDYLCTIKRSTPDGDRRIKDSYWHCIGVPSYAEVEHAIGGDDDYTTGDDPDVPKVNPLNWGTTDIVFLYDWDPSENLLTPIKSTPYTFKPMHSYMVQYSQDYITWTAVTNTISSIAARMTETPDREYQLALLRDDEEQDHTYVRMTDDVNVSTGFEFNYDLSKETNRNRGNIWTVTTDTVEVAGNSMPHPLATTIVPVGVKIAANGEYTFTMPEGTYGSDVYLIDNVYGARTNLGLMDYTVDLTAGTYDGRFSLEFPVQNVVTDIENDGMNRSDELNDEIDVRKVFVGGRLYIIRDGKAYDATGKRVE